MNISAANVAVILGILNLAAFLYVVVLRLAKIESRVELLWSFQLRRGVVESVEKGLLRSESPLQLDPQLINRYALVFGKAKTIADEMPRASDAELASEFEKNLWPDIMKVCLAEHINHGGCLAIFLKYVRPESKLFTEFDDFLGGLK